jgi:hypothetical protein
MTGYYKIAGIVIEIRSIYEEIHIMSQNYRVPSQAPEITIEICREDIDSERERAARLAGREDALSPDTPDCFLETIAVHRKLAAEMIWKNVLLFHGSAVAVDGQAYLFTAKSGTGKSTHVRLWRQKFGERAVVINDDKPMLRVYGDRVGICGTPWNGKHHLDTNTEVPLKAICIIRQAQENHIERIHIHDALAEMWAQAYRPSDDIDMGKMLELFGSIAELVPLYRMGCNLQPEAADVAWAGMQEKPDEQ